MKRLLGLFLIVVSGFFMSNFASAIILAWTGYIIFLYFSKNIYKDFLIVIFFHLFTLFLFLIHPFASIIFFSFILLTIVDFELFKFVFS